MPQPDSNRYEKYLDFYKTAYSEEVSVFEEAYFGDGNPGQGPFQIDWQDLDAYDPNLAADVLKDPEIEIINPPGKDRKPLAIRALNEHSERRFLNATVRVHNLPEAETYRVGDLRTTHLGDLIAVEGQVVKVHAVEPMITTAFYECQRCGTGREYPQDYGEIQEPHACEACEQDNPPWKLVRRHSELVDFQCVSIIPAETNRENPPSIPVYLKQDLCDRLGKGDVITVVGVYDIMPFQLQKEVQLNVFIEANQIDQEVATTADKLTTSELDSEITTLVSALAEEGATFGADEAAVIESLTDRGVREEEVTDRVDELKNQNELAAAGDGLLMVR